MFYNIMYQKIKLYCDNLIKLFNLFLIILYNLLYNNGKNYLKQ